MAVQTGATRQSVSSYRYVIVAAGFLILMVAYGVQYSFGVFFKPVVAEFGWPRAVYSGAYSLYMITQGLFAMLAGRLNDRFGPRIVVSTCGIFLGLGYMLMSGISQIGQLYLFYGVLASMGTGSWVPLLSTGARWFTRNRGLISGIIVAGVGMGTIIMPPVSNALITAYTWRTSYLIVGGAGLVISVAIAQLLRRGPVGEIPAHDRVASPALVEDSSRISLRNALGTRQFWISCIIFFAFLYSIHTLMVHVVPHATDIGLSPEGAAGILSVVGALSIAGRIVMGSASDRIGGRRCMFITFAIMLTALLVLQTARELWAFYAFAVAFGFSYGGSVALQSPAVAEFFGLYSHGAILGAIIFAATLGGAVGPLISGRIFDLTGGYYPAFWLCAALLGAGLALTALLKPGRCQA